MNDKPSHLVDQTILHSQDGQPGNCMQAAVATLLGLPLNAVPHFAESGDPVECWTAFDKFFADHGYEALLLPGNWTPECDFLASGPSSRGTSHMVVMHGNKVKHDPHPSREGLLSVSTVRLIVPKSLAAPPRVPTPPVPAGYKRSTVHEDHVVVEFAESGQAEAFHIGLSEPDPALDYSPSQPVFGIIDPDYARVFTIARVIAWQFGYSVSAQGSFTRDLDLLLVPWTERALPSILDAIVARIADATGLAIQGPPSEKPHGRRAWSLLFMGFGDPRWVDISAFAPPKKEAPPVVKEVDLDNPDPTSEFQEGQWWVQELDNMANKLPMHYESHEFKRAVAVVHHLLRSVRMLELTTRSTETPSKEN